MNEMVLANPDETKHYKCYYCEEEVESIPYISLKTKKKVWRHVVGGQVQCGTVATPSNIEVPT